MDVPAGARRPCVKTLRCPDCASRAACAVGKLPQAERERLAPLIRELSFHKGDVLQEQEQVASKLRFVKIGTVQLVRRGVDGERRVIALIGRGQALGAFALLGQPEALSGVSAAATRVCEIDVAMLHGQGLLAGRFLAELVQLQVQSFGRLADWAHMTRLRGARGRLLAALCLLAVEQGSSCIRMPSQAALAELLGATRETVARSLRALIATRDIVRRDRWHYELHSPAARNWLRNGQGLP